MADSAAKYIVNSKNADSKVKKSLVKAGTSKSESAKKAQKAKLRREYQREAKKLSAIGKSDMTNKQKHRLSAIQEGLKRLDGKGSFGRM